jgi:hypothetical protein
MINTLILLLAAILILGGMGIYRSIKKSIDYVNEHREEAGAWWEESERPFDLDGIEGLFESSGTKAPQDRGRTDSGSEEIH